MNAVLETPGKLWTYADYLAQEDETPFQIINGHPVMSPSPELFHQRWARKILIALESHVNAGKLGEVFFAPVDVVLDPQNVVQPDIIFVSKARSEILQRRGIMGAPDLVVEIISPSSLRIDRYEKRALYARFGVKEYWLADVANRSLEVLQLVNGEYELHSCATDEGAITSQVLPGFSLNLSALA